MNKIGVLASPPLLKCLVQAVAEVEYADLPQARLGALEVLESLIGAAPSLLEPHVATVLRALLPHAVATGSNRPEGGGTSWRVIEILALLSGVAPRQFEPHMQAVLASILAHLDPTARLSHRERASVLRSLAGLCRHVGWAIEPYRTQPELLPALLSCITQTEDKETRLAASEAIGAAAGSAPEPSSSIWTTTFS